MRIKPFRNSSILGAMAILGVQSAQAVDPAAVGAECHRQGGDTQQIRNCIQQRLGSATSQKKDDSRQVAASQPSNTDAGASAKNTQRAVTPAAATLQEKSAKGCPFLIYDQYGLYHVGGTRLCNEDVTYSCDIAGKNHEGKIVYSWRVANEHSCVSGGQAKIIEGNKTIYHRVDGGQDGD